MDLKTCKVRRPFQGKSFSPPPNQQKSISTYAVSARRAGWVACNRRNVARRVAHRVGAARGTHLCGALGAAVASCCHGAPRRCGPAHARLRAAGAASELSASRSGEAGSICQWWRARCSAPAFGYCAGIGWRDSSSHAASDGAGGSHGAQWHVQRSNGGAARATSHPGRWEAARGASQQLEPPLATPSTAAFPTIDGVVDDGRAHACGQLEQRRSCPLCTWVSQPLRKWASHFRRRAAHFRRAARFRRAAHFSRAPTRRGASPLRHRCSLEPRRSDGGRGRCSRKREEAQGEPADAPRAVPGG